MVGERAGRWGRGWGKANGCNCYSIVLLTASFLLYYIFIHHAGYSCLVLLVSCILIVFDNVLCIEADYYKKVTVYCQSMAGLYVDVQ